MIVKYPKSVSENDFDKIERLATSCGISLDTARLLFTRNVDTEEKAARFLSPSKKWFYDPLLLDGIKDAVSRIEYARDKHEKVLVFGDYDADGICATTVLCGALKIYGITALKCGRMRHRAQRGTGIRVPVFIVEPDDGDIFGDPDPVLPAVFEKPESHPVGIEEDGVVMFGGQFGADPETVFEIAWQPVMAMGDRAVGQSLERGIEPEVAGGDVAAAG